MAFPTLFPGVAYPGAKYTFPEAFPDAATHMRCRLVAYTPFGAQRGVLPDALETQIVTPLGELATASVHYHRSGINAVQLDGFTELGFEYFDTEKWVEPPNCRFLSMRGSFDHLEQERTRKYSAVGVGWMLRKAKVWAPNGLKVDLDGKVQFNSATAGQIMATLIQNAKGRGWGSGISINFNSRVDSNGAAWKKVVTIAYALEMDLDTILTNLYQQGVCDYRWQGRTLNIFNPDTAIGRDLTLGQNPVQLKVADGQTSAPEEWTNEDLLTDALVIGENGKQWQFGNGATTALGRLESVIAQGGVTDQGTADLLSRLDLTAGSQTRFSYTREFSVTTETKAWPFRDYAAGDWVFGQRGTAFERLRTASLSLTVNRDGVKGHAILGDRLDDLLSKLAKRTKGITGGASAGGSGVRPAPEGPDKRTPAAPTGLVVTADAYIDDAGVARGLVAIDWAHAGTATDGTAMSVESYQVHYRINATGEPWKQLATTQETELSYSPLPIFKADGATPEQLAFKVRAIGSNGTPSAFTNPVAVIMEDDTTPPPVPYFTAADVTTWLRTVKVVWGGKGTITGTDQVDMPRDFQKINVYRGASPAGPWTLVDSTYTASGLVHQSGSMPLATVWYVLTAVDGSGNESVRSLARPITPQANVNIKEITDVIDGAMLGENSVDYVALLASDQMWAKLAQFVEIRAGMIAANAITTDTLEAGAVKAAKIDANAVEATHLKGDAITAKHTLTGPLYQTDPAVNRGIKIGPSVGGIKSYDNNGNVMLNITNSSATFTGRVTSGFGKDKAILSNNLFDGRPGIMIETDQNYFMEPCVVSYGSAANTAQQGSLLLRAATWTADYNPGNIRLLRTAVQMSAGDAGSLQLSSSTFQANVNGFSGSAGAAEFAATVSQARMRYGLNSIEVGDNSDGIDLYVPITSTVRSWGNFDVQGSLSVVGAKNFIMPHPSRPGFSLLHGATESPVSGIEYWGEGEIGPDGTTTVTLPDYFEDLAKARNRTVLVTGNGNAVSWSNITDGTVIVAGTPETTFSWLVKAERFGGDFDVERWEEPITKTNPNTEAP